MNFSTDWSAVYTKPRWEKKVYQQFLKRDIDAYCPLNKVRKQWSDRIKTIHEPLFKSYVFVRVQPENQTNIRYVDGVINFVYWQGKPARIKNEEIELIRKFMSEYTNVEALPVEIKPFDEVMISRGVLVGETGRVIKVLHNSAEIEIGSLGYKLVARFEKTSLEPVQKPGLI